MKVTRIKGVLRIPDYIKWVKSLPCRHCRNPYDIDPHHIIGFGRGMMGGKSGDHFAIPLCRQCHDHFHHDMKGAPDEWNKAQMRWLHETMELWFLECVT